MMGAPPGWTSGTQPQPGAAAGVECVGVEHPVLALMPCADCGISPIEMLTKYVVVTTLI